MFWIAATLLASALQTVRNGVQRGLTGSLGTLGATYVRFLYGLPFAVLFLLLVAVGTGEALPAIGGWSALYALGAGLAQILATALMLWTMKSRSFAVTTAIIKTEPVLVALAGLVLLGEVLHPLALGGILVATLGVLLLSRLGGAQTAGPKSVLSGIMAAAFFALSAVGFRAAILELPSGSPVLRSSMVLVLGLLLQSAMLIAYLVMFDRGTLRKVASAWRQSLPAGVAGALASQFWFIGFALTSAANVRTLALVEILFAQAFAWITSRAVPERRDLLGMLVLVAGLLVLLIHS
ncbi:MAG: multidrug transporter permease [Devosia sp.]|nr:multidrug transporter permease [Devosia sp.]